jgi:hypothetical protein
LEQVADDRLHTPQLKMLNQDDLVLPAGQYIATVFLSYIYSYRKTNKKRSKQKAAGVRSNIKTKTQCHGGSTTLIFFLLRKRSTTLEYLI